MLTWMSFGIIIVTSLENTTKVQQKVEDTLSLISYHQGHTARNKSAIFHHISDDIKTEVEIGFIDGNENDFVTAMSGDGTTVAVVSMFKRY